MKKTSKAPVSIVVSCNRCNVAITAMIWGKDVEKADLSLVCTSMSDSEYREKTNQERYFAEAKNSDLGDFGETLNLLSLSDIKALKQGLLDICEMLRYKYQIEEISFSPIDFLRFRATEFLINRIEKSLNKIGLFKDNNKTLAYSYLNSSFSNNFYGSINLTI